jgi:alkylhydroperoxidase family enzyme
MLGFAEAFTLASHKMSAEDIAQLREVGFADPEIVDITLCAGYRHYITRVADATGIEVDPELNIAPVLVEAYSHARAPVAREGERHSEARGPGAGKDGSWIAVAERPEDDPRLAHVWGTWRAEYGFVPGLLRALSLRPEAVRTLDIFWRRACFGGSAMGRLLECRIGLAVAERLDSPWLRALYAAALRRASAKGDAGDVPEGGRVILQFVEQITDRAIAITRAAVEQVRTAGLADAEILDVIVAAALLNALGRMANALGVPPDLDIPDAFADHPKARGHAGALGGRAGGPS